MQLYISRLAQRSLKVVPDKDDLTWLFIKKNRSQDDNQPELCYFVISIRRWSVLFVPLSAVQHLDFP